MIRSCREVFSLRWGGRSFGVRGSETCRLAVWRVWNETFCQEITPRTKQKQTTLKRCGRTLGWDAAPKKLAFLTRGRWVGAVLIMRLLILGAFFVSNNRFSFFAATAHRAHAFASIGGEGMPNYRQWPPMRCISDVSTLGGPVASSKVFCCYSFLPLAARNVVF